MNLERAERPRSQESPSGDTGITPLEEVPPDFPFVIDFASGLYFHREGPGILTGQANPEQSPGDDETAPRYCTGNPSSPTSNGNRIHE